MPTARPRRKGAKSAPATPAPAPRPFVAHHLVPPHELLSVEESQQVLKELGVGVERLPRILLNDPGLKTDPKYVQAREAREALGGRLVRVRRPSQTAGQAVAYRVLVASSGD